MYMKETKTGHMVEVLSLSDLFDPFNPTVVGRLHFGEEVQEPEKFVKTELAFLSNEVMPRCWMDPHYREAELRRTA